jgi:hypothetical protein
MPKNVMEGTAISALLISNPLIHDRYSRPAGYRRCLLEEHGLSGVGRNSLQFWRFEPLHPVPL